MSRTDTAMETAPARGGHGTVAALVRRGLARLRRWWGYRPERRYMRGAGRAAS